VLNILINAQEAMPRGGRITISSDRTPDGGNVELRISDTGQGISKEIIPKLFEPFFTTKKAGTGLGLSIAYGIVERHGGAIRVEGAQGGGTTMVIAIPVDGEKPDG
jgi:signal transduction histidine kinase